MGTNQLDEPTISSATTDNQDEPPTQSIGDVRRRNNQTNATTPSTTAEGMPLVTFNERRMGTELIILFFWPFFCLHNGFVFAQSYF